MPESGLEDFEEPLATLGRLLADRGERFEMLAIGGGALQLLGLITRPTRDIDVVAMVDSDRLVPVEALPPALKRAVEDTGLLLGLPATWFNIGPRSLVEFGLPPGILTRAHRRQWDGLALRVADRRDQIFFKLYAAVDQGPRSKHFDDLQRLQPSKEELLAAAAWVRTHDPSEGFARELRPALRSLGVDSGDD